MNLFGIRNSTTLEHALQDGLTDAYGTLRSPKAYRFHVPHLLGFFGKDQPISQISVFDVEAYQLFAVAKWCRGTVRHQLAFLSRCYQVAIRTGRVSVNPVRSARWVPRDDARRVWVAQNRFPELLAHLSPNDRHTTMVFVYTGLRRMEAFNLRQSEVDWTMKEILVTTYKSGVRGEPKVRPVPIHPGMVEVLHWLETRANAPFVLPGGVGRARASESYRSRLKRALAKCGMEGVRLHDLRRTAASWLLESGANLSVIRDVLGHGSTTVTEIYARTSAHQMHRAVANVPWVGFGLEDVPA